MGRMPRINIENTLYYVTGRGDNNENIFKDSPDYKAYLDLLDKYRGLFGFKLFAFVLMPNHLHLLIELPKNATVSQIMHNLHSNYTKYFNKRHQQKGHLFQERYKLALLEKEPYLLDMSAYIHLNPKALGLAEDLESYPYSSYPFYLGRRGGLPDLTGEVKEVLGYLKGKEYANFAKDFYRDKSRAMSEELSRKVILGSEGFIEKVKSEVESYKSQEEKVDQAVAAAGIMNNKKLVLIGVIIILILGSASLYLYKSALRMKERSSSEIDDYYKRMSKTLETEKQKARYLEERLIGEARKK